MEIPVDFIKEMECLLGDKKDLYLKSLSEEPKRGLRVNLNYISVEDFLKDFPYEVNKLNVSENYFQFLSKEKIGNTVQHHLGLIYLQEPSSMLSALCLKVQEGEKVLDLCSAPGGKAGQILEKNKNGVVVLNEISRSRANILLSNIERQGFKNAIITSMSPQELSGKFLNYFDKILVDAPCSGEGMFRKDPQTVGEWNSGLAEFNHKRQMEILLEADKMLKEGGTLVYSTCTFNKNENERTVYEFAKEFGYKIVETPQEVILNTDSGFEYNGNRDTCLTRRCFPFGGFGEGQFIAKLIKVSENKNEYYYKKPKKLDLNANERKIVQDFVKTELNNDNFNFYKIGANIYIYNNVPCDANGVVCLGVNLGSIVNGRLVLHHQFFKSYGELFKNKINLSINDERVNKYLKGEEIDVQAKNGVACLMVNHVPLGGGKVVNGKLKNHYPKGLRINN